MSSKTLTTLLILTAVALLTATLVIRNRNAAVAGDLEAGLLIPSLSETINDITRIEVKGPEDSYVIEREGDQWGLAAKSGYPVDFARVKQTILTVSELAKIEPKTADPARFAELGLEGLGADGTWAADSASKELILSSADGSPLASLVIGKTRASQSQHKSFYARLSGEDQSWLVEGNIDLDGESSAWLDKQIVKIAKDRVAAVRVAHSDGEVVTVIKNQPGDKTLEVQNIPEGRELSYASVGNGMASGLEWCNLDDVLPASEVELTQPDSTATFETFDGLVVAVNTYKQEDETTYATFGARYDAARVYQPAEGELLETPLSEEHIVQQEVEELNARTSGWVYVIPEFNRRTYAKRMDELLKPEETEEPEDALLGGDEIPIPTTQPVLTDPMPELVPEPVTEPPTTQPATDGDHEGHSHDGEGDSEEPHEKAENTEKPHTEGHDSDEHGSEKEPNESDEG